jgi:hypothetical protein
MRLNEPYKYAIGRARGVETESVAADRTGSMTIFNADYLADGEELRTARGNYRTSQ